MKDNEIIKALERCPQHTECCYCNSLDECGNKRILTTSALDLINRLINNAKKDNRIKLNENHPYLLAVSNVYTNNETAATIVY